MLFRSRSDACQRDVLQRKVEHLLAIRHYELQEIHADHLVITVVTNLDQAIFYPAIFHPANWKTLPRMLARVDAASAKIPPLEGPR